MQYCSRCVYPKVSVNLHLDEEGVCSACRVAEAFENIPQAYWVRRQEKFAEIVENVKRRQQGNYDCLIPVSGGKDSYYQAHVMAKEYGLKPLLMTYHGNNYLPEGDYNRDHMREAFDADHIVWGPSVEVLKKLNRICFKMMGDMNWQNHCGIMTAPIIVAVRFNIPLMIWGETAWDISGMYEPDDFVEFSARMRHEHNLRGYEWYDMLNDPQDRLTEKDMLWAKYPTDDEIVRVGVRGLYIGNFFKWDPNKHTQLVMKEYGFKPAQKPFQRTYRQMSNLDDRYENGIHDLLKFIKFGYGRASDHSCKDIRTGYITREQGVEYVRTLDHVVSDDLQHWLDYVTMTEDEWWLIADGFRDPRVWWIEHEAGQAVWVKDNLWGGTSSYGPVHIPKDKWGKYQREA